MWAAARVGILLMAEVIVGAASAPVFAGERLSATEVLGGALMFCAAVLEIWPVKTSRP